MQASNIAVRSSWGTLYEMFFKQGVQDQKVGNYSGFYTSSLLTTSLSNSGCMGFRVCLGKAIP